jgi:hypothetical protein
MAGVPPKSGQAYTLYFSVTSQADSNIFQAAPTIAAGDFRYSNDAGATFANPATLPSVVAGNNKVIQAPLTVAEMTPSVGDKILFAGSDQIGTEWQDIFIEITVSTNTIDDLGTAIAGVLAAVGQVCACVVSRLFSNPGFRKCVRGVDLELYRGDTWEQPVYNLGDLTTATEIWFTAKRDKDNTDAQADIKVSSVAGLEAINQVAATVPANASITVVDAASGHIEVRIEDVETAKLTDSDGHWYYDVQWTDDTDTTTPRRGKLAVVGDVTRETVT